MSQQYPPNQPPQWGPQPGFGAPPPQKKNNAGKIIGFSCLGIAVVIGVFVALGALVMAGSDGDSTGASGPVLEVTSSAPAKDPEGKAPPKAKAPAGPEGDVKITGCEVSGATGWPKADVLITNGSSDTSNYIVSVEFVDASGKRLGDAMAASNNVAAGQEVATEAQSLDKVTGKVECRVTKVTRYAS